MATRRKQTPEVLPDNVIRFPFGAAAAAPEPEPEPEPVQTLVDGEQSDPGNKLAQFTRMVDQGLTTVVVQTYVAGVSVPREFSSQLRMMLNWSHRFRLPDFAYDESGIVGTLSFSSGDHRVVLPWDSVYIMFRPEQAAWAWWPTSVPAELRPFLPQMLGSLKLPWP